MFSKLHQYNLSVLNASFLCAFRVRVTLYKHEWVVLDIFWVLLSFYAILGIWLGRFSRSIDYFNTNLARSLYSLTIYHS